MRKPPATTRRTKRAASPAPALVRHAPRTATTAGDPARDDLHQILVLIRDQTKRDFRGYRLSMVLRRVKRRMALCRLDRADRYISYLHAHPDEVGSLASDLSIGVTAFFREPAAFEILERMVIPDLVHRGVASDDSEPPVRVWVPGCATGEEAYSIAMLFLEQFAAAGQVARVQIFATDMDEESLDAARGGVYPETAVAGITAERLRRFFCKTDTGRYQVSKELREVITFAPQNLMIDAPFSRLQLISCRNVLIYLDPAVQAKVLALFHFALSDGGYLLLGPAESIGSAIDCFQPISGKWRVYRRVDTGDRRMADIPILPAPPGSPAVAQQTDGRRPAAVAELMHRALLADFAPAAVLVGPHYQILSVQGPVGEYLEFPPGELTRDLLAMARPGLRPSIRSACQQAIQTRQAATETAARVKRQRAYVSCAVSARPVGGAPPADTLVLVTFQDVHGREVKVAPVPVRTGVRRRGDEPGVVRQLEQELQATRDDLQGTIDDLQTSNEELKASHEEMMSMNEELQSTNEEMETLKEEFQSLNEELSTVNSQLQDKVQELDAANNDMLNLLASIDIATVILDADLRIKRFTPPTAKLLNLLDTDVGRPLRDLSLRGTDQALMEDCRRVLETLSPVESVVQAGHGRSFLRRVLPYRTSDRRIDGVVITWVDVTARLAAEAESHQLTAVLGDSNDAVVLLDLEGHVTGWNHGAERLYGYAEAEARSLHLHDLAPESQRDGVDEAIRCMTGDDVASASMETQRKIKDGRVLEVWSTMTLLRDATGDPVAVVMTERDVTEIKQALAARQGVELYRQFLERLPAGAVLCEGGRLTLNRAAETITGYERGELTTTDAWVAALHGDRAKTARECYESGARIGECQDSVALAISRKDGATRHLELTICRLDETRELWMLLDVTAADEALQALRRSEDYLRSIVTTAADGIVTIDEHGTVDTFNRAAESMFGYTTAEVVGQNVRMLMPAPYRDEHDAYLSRYLETGEAHIIGVGREVTGRRKDGTTFPLDLAVSQIDHRRRFTGVLRDLSARRDLEWRLAESQVEERRHMARELHDEIGGHMTGIALLAQAVHGRLEKVQSPVVESARELVHAIEGAHQSLRAVIRGLMPVDDVPGGLMAALEHLACHSQTTSGVSCRFECDPPVHVDDAGTARHLFRIAQEAINNAVRHAHPSQIVVNLRRQGERLVIAVSDDGVGIEVPPPDHGGIGLASMRQRAYLLGGDCVIRPSEGGGTLVVCWVPADAPAVRAARRGAVTRQAGRRAVPPAPRAARVRR